MTQLQLSARPDLYADQLLAEISGKIGNQEFEAAEALMTKARPVLPRTILDILRARLLFARGAHDEAKRALTVATQRHPKEAALWAALGGLQAQTGAFNQAVSALSQSVQIDPTNPVNWDLLAAALQRINFQNRAIEACGFALKIKPDFVPSLVRLSQIYLHLKDWKKTADFGRRALAINPASGDALFNLGIALIELRKHDEAAECFEKLSELSEQDEEAKINLGNALLGGDKIGKAIEIYERVVERKPDWSGGFHNLGNAYSNNSEWDKAREAYETAFRLDPNNTEVLFSLGCLQLHLGEFRLGFANYEHRNKSRDRIQKRFESIPVWSGEPLAGKRVVVFGEQGLGDNIQIIRYVREIFKAGAARVVFQGYPMLHALFSTVHPRLECAETINEGDFDYQAASMSLPHLFNSSIETLPKDTPYIHAEAAREKFWRDEIGMEGFRIGIAWQGNPDGKVDNGRSPGLAPFVKLMNLPSARFISLQKNFGLEQIEQLKADKIETLGDDFDTKGGAFLDTVAVMKALDLVIVSDTALAHVAGALGVPTVLVLKRHPDWRWMDERPDTPWYPTTTLIRQREHRNWDETFDRVRAHVEKQIEKRRNGHDFNSGFGG